MCGAGAGLAGDFRVGAARLGPYVDEEEGEFLL